MAGLRLGSREPALDSRPTQLRLTATAVDVFPRSISSYDDYAIALNRPRLRTACDFLDKLPAEFILSCKLTHLRRWSMGCDVGSHSSIIGGAALPAR